MAGQAGANFGPLGGLDKDGNYIKPAIGVSDIMYKFIGDQKRFVTELREKYAQPSQQLKKDSIYWNSVLIHELVHFADKKTLEHFAFVKDTFPCASGDLLCECKYEVEFNAFAASAYYFLERYSPAELKKIDGQEIAPFGKIQLINTAYFHLLNKLPRKLRKTIYCSENTH